ncbi:MAG: hypothetical protein MK052_11490 [Alphaproteobacteria bacterium]|nr:hypothetical protein [Alphaproteobacteria bacterium]
MQYKDLSLTGSEDTNETNVTQEAPVPVTDEQQPEYVDFSEPSGQWEDADKTENAEDQKSAQSIPTLGEQIFGAQTPDEKISTLETLNNQLGSENFQLHETNKSLEKSSFEPPEIDVIHKQFIKGLGKYIVPEENTLQNQFHLIYDRSNALDFWPNQSPAFDGLVAQTFLDPAFSRPNHPKYFDYEPLRDNVSTVRNFAMQAVLNGVDTAEPDQYSNAQRKLEQMGREIGVALQRDSLFKRPGSASLDVSDASEPGVGTAEIYSLLVKKQNKGGLIKPIKELFGYNYSDWNLPDVEKSPFSKANVEAFCLSDIVDAKPDGPAPIIEEEPAQPVESQLNSTAMQQANYLSSAEKISMFGSSVAGAAFSLDRVKKLPAPVRERSIELAREILDKMRITHSSSDRNEWLEMGSDNALIENESLEIIADIYADSFHAGVAADPSLAEKPEIQQGNMALGKLAYMMKQQAGMKLVDEGQMDSAYAVMNELENMPEEWKNHEGESIETLLSQLQNGLEMSYRTIQQAEEKGLNPAKEDDSELSAAQQAAQQKMAQLRNNGEDAPDGPLLQAGMTRGRSEGPQAISNDALDDLLKQNPNLQPEIMKVRAMQQKGNGGAAPSTAIPRQRRTVEQTARDVRNPEDYRTSVMQPTHADSSLKR